MNIIKLAEKANVSIRGYYDESGSTPAELKRFARLVLEEAVREIEGPVGGAVQKDEWWNGFKTARSQCVDIIRRLMKEVSK
jgi:hypothetical protein